MIVTQEQAADSPEEKKSGEEQEEKQKAAEPEKTPSAAEAPGKKKLSFNFDFLQKLGKVLMTVIAVMPAAGLMISLGKLVQMGGADVHMIYMVGSTMESIGWAVINNLHILFAACDRRLLGKGEGRRRVCSGHCLYTD